MKTSNSPFFYLACTGLTLSIIVHITSLLNIPSPLGDMTWILHIGIFIVWIPTMFYSFRLTRDFKQKDFWKAALRGCPDWMKKGIFLLFVYAFLNFIVFMFLDVRGQSSTGENANSPNVFRGVSGHWMIFYATAAAVLYSSARTKKHDSTRRCPNGHPVSPSADFCEKCGKTIASHKALKQ